MPQIGLSLQAVSKVDSTMTNHIGRPEADSPCGESYFNLYFYFYFNIAKCRPAKDSFRVVNFTVGKSITGMEERTRQREKEVAVQGNSFLMQEDFSSFSSLSSAILLF